MIAIWIALASPAMADISIAEVPHVKIGQFPQEVATSFTTADGLPSDDVHAIHIDSNGAVWADTDQGWAVLQGSNWSPAVPPSTQMLLGYVTPEKYAAIGDTVNQAVLTSDGRVVAATNKGLQIQTGAGFEPLIVEDGLGRRWGTFDVRGVAFDSRGQLWFATLAGAACQTAEGWHFYTGREGLPDNDFTVVQSGPNGVVWFGTHLGAIRYDGQTWAYRQGRRWLPDDDIRDISVDKHGNTWFATTGGVGLIEQRMMMLGGLAG